MIRDSRMNRYLKSFQLIILINIDTNNINYALQNQDLLSDKF